MSTIINATTTNGVVIQPDNSGSLVLQTNNGTTALTIDTSQNVTFNGTRIYGDFINATLANRVLFQSSTTNANTSIGAIPNGTGTISNFRAYNNSDPTNSSFIDMAVIGTSESRITSNIAGTGSYLPMTFQTGGSERMRIDSSGRVTMPYQPAVHAGLTGSAGNTAASPIVWNSVLTNVGNHYNSSTGLFTCPVAAVYEVFASACVQVSANGGWDLTVRKNGTQVNVQYGKGFFELYSNPFSGYPMMTVKMLISCSANDTLAVGGTVYREAATSYSTFNIRLVS